MARDGTKTGGRNWKKGESGSKEHAWKKGQSGNPGGSKEQKMPLPNLLFKTLGTIEYRDIITQLFFSTRTDVEAAKDDEALPLINRTVAKVMLRAYEQACHATLEGLIARVIGRLRDAPPEEPGKSRTGEAVLEEIRKVINDPRNERQG